MRFSRTLAFTGLAVALAGVTAVAAAERLPVHEMVVHLPGGGIERIRYTGNVVPHILVADEAAPMTAESFLDTAFGPASPFAELDRISTEMERQANALLRQAALMQSLPDAQLQQAALANAPAGASSYTVVSTSNGKGVCIQSMRVMAMGEGKAPQVVRNVSGDCAAASASSSTAVTPAAGVPAKPAAIDRNTI